MMTIDKIAKAMNENFFEVVAFIGGGRHDDFFYCNHETFVDVAKRGDVDDLEIAFYNYKCTKKYEGYRVTDISFDLEHDDYFTVYIQKA